MYFNDLACIFAFAVAFPVLAREAGEWKILRLRYYIQICLVALTGCKYVGHFCIWLLGRISSLECLAAASRRLGVRCLHLLYAAAYQRSDVDSTCSLRVLCRSCNCMSTKIVIYWPCKVMSLASLLTVHYQRSCRLHRACMMICVFWSAS